MSKKRLYLVCYTVTTAWGLIKNTDSVVILTDALLDANTTEDPVKDSKLFTEIVTAIKYQHGAGKKLKIHGWTPYKYIYLDSDEYYSKSSIEV